ncbi:hypothetical protein BVX99_03230 [bacterium F16]|nr:hypothetical protein BVX99_03230 [bacterium F16]
MRLAQPTDDFSLGLTGFGASNHLVLKLVRHQYPSTRLCVFARSAVQRNYALALGADWVGLIDDSPPFELNAIIDTTPAWKPVVAAMKHLKPGGRLVINAIRKDDHDKRELMKLDYGRHLWMEKEIKSVANVSRNDVRDCLALVAESGIHPKVQRYGFMEANRALLDLCRKDNEGAKVLLVSESLKDI